MRPTLSRSRPDARAIHARERRFVFGARLVHRLRRRQLLLEQLAGAIERDLGALDIGRRGGALRFSGGNRGFRLLDLIAELPLLQPQRRLALADLRLDALGAVFVVGAIGRQLAWLDLGDRLVPSSPRRLP